MENSTLMRRYEVWCLGTMLLAANGLQVCADFIDGKQDGHALLGATIREVEGWQNNADGEFQIVSVVCEFRYPDYSQGNLPL